MLAMAATATEIVLALLAGWAGTSTTVAQWSWGPQLALTLSLIGLGRVMAVLVPVIAAPVILYAASAERADPALARLIALLVAFTGAMELLVGAGDLLTLLIGWELVGATSWALIGFDWRDPSRPRAALDAYLVTRAGDLGLYLAAGAAVVGTGSLSFGSLELLRGPALHVVAAGLLVAAAAKSAQLPFSPWLFRAMVGPSPASALLHSATMVAAGAYALARLGPLLHAASWLAPTVLWLGLATALAGGLVASVQRDLKKGLAASTSAQYGLMLVAIGAGFPAAAGLHLVTHAAFKALLFLGAGVALHVTDTIDLGRLQTLALGGRLPRIAAFFWIGALALAAIPPLGGAYSKEQIVAAAEAAGPIVLATVLAAGALSAFYALRLALLAFGWPFPAAGTLAGATAARRIDRRPTVEIVAVGTLAALSVALGVLWLPSGAAIARRTIPGPFPHVTTPIALLSLGLALALGVGGTWLLRSRHTLVDLRLPSALTTWVAGWYGLPVLARAAVARPTFWLARHLATLDGRVVDGGVRAAVAIGALVSRALTWWGERGIDGLVGATAVLGQRVAAASGTADDRGVDAAVNGVAHGIGVAGTKSRRLQTGLVHQYYLVLAAGVLVIVGVAMLWP